MTIIARLYPHRSRFHSVAYWLLGIWAIELTFWMCVGVFVLAYWCVRAVMPLIVLGFGLTAAGLAALYFCLRGRQYRSRAWHVDPHGSASR